MVQLANTHKLQRMNTDYVCSLGEIGVSQVIKKKRSNLLFWFSSCQVCRGASNIFDVDVYGRDGSSIKISCSSTMMGTNFSSSQQHEPCSMNAVRNDDDHRSKNVLQSTKSYKFLHFIQVLRHSCLRTWNPVKFVIHIRLNLDFF